MNINGNDRLSTNEVAERWQCRPETAISRLRQRGAEPTQWGRSWMWLRTDVEAIEAAADVGGRFS